MFYIICFCTFVYMEKEIKKYSDWLIDFLCLDSLDESPGDVMDDLDFIESIMEFEKQFSCVVEDGALESSYFDTFKDYIDWLASYVDKSSYKEDGMELAKSIWNQHIEVFKLFDLVCHNGHSLEEEIKAVSLFSAIITLKAMYKQEPDSTKVKIIKEALSYLKNNKYFS